MTISYFNMYCDRNNAIRIDTTNYGLILQSCIIHRAGESFWIVPGTINEDNVDKFYGEQ